MHKPLEFHHKKIERQECVENNCEEAYALRAEKIRDPYQAALAISHCPWTL